MKMECQTINDAALFDCDKSFGGFRAMEMNICCRDGRPTLAVKITEPSGTVNLFSVPIGGEEQ